MSSSSLELPSHALLRVDPSGGCFWKITWWRSTSSVLFGFQGFLFGSVDVPSIYQLFLPCNQNLDKHPLPRSGVMGEGPLITDCSTDRRIEGTHSSDAFYSQEFVGFFLE